MKKRSLFAAIAMLIVSALVLTSTTYAWFVSTSSATVGMDQAKIAPAGTGVQVRSHQANAAWTDTLDEDHLVHATDGMFASTFKPISTTNLSDFVTTSIGSQNKYAAFPGTVTKGTDYTQYQFDVRTLAATDRAIGTLTIGGTSPSTRVLIEKALTTGGTTGTFTKVGVFAKTADTWDGISTQPEGGITDLATPSYITSSDFADPSTAGTYLKSATAIAAQDGKGIDFGVVGNDDSNYATIKVTIWVEGNDDQCYASSAAGKTIEVSWGFAGADPTSAAYIAAAPNYVTVQSPMPFGS